ncbi:MULTISPECIES: DUF1304 domain-containing protein [Rothia]|uniref:Uncharacterized protein n=1 Tax=Rothia nasimurium TaxID=85336 RepID=A0A1Y1RNC4_9MICC|nr:MULTISPECIES: DUF1304 domain-containing protein [Rothia]ORC16110.1 hypothetical protein A7979_05780 [Rothia nasimurium]
MSVRGQDAGEPPHAFIFYIGFFAWSTPRGLSVFGLTRESAEQTREMVYNQGFYNLFLGFIAAAGVILYWAGLSEAGLALVIAGAGSMLAAAAVLFLALALLALGVSISKLPVRLSEKLLGACSPNPR